MHRSWHVMSPYHMLGIVVSYFYSLLSSSPPNAHTRTNTQVRAHTSLAAARLPVPPGAGGGGTSLRMSGPWAVTAPVSWRLPPSHKSARTLLLSAPMSP